MALYIVPGPLGGQELELLGTYGGFDNFKWPLAENLSAQLRLPAGLAKPVKPPLPEEPPVGTVVLVGGEACQRFDVPYEEKMVWASVGAVDRWTWVQLCDLALPDTPIRLVPAEKEQS